MEQLNNPADSQGRSFASQVLSWFVNPGHRAPNRQKLAAQLGGKHILITGASFGIGEATAYQLAAAGAVVLLVARSEKKLNQIVNEIRSTGGRAHAYPADLTDMAAVDHLVRAIEQDLGHVDVVVNNAGKSMRKSISLSYDRFHDFERTMAVNYLGPVRLNLALLPELRSRKTGHLVNISTLGVRLPPAPRWAAYHASKAAFDCWIRSVAHEIRADGVQVTSIYMPLVYTRMSAPTPIFQKLPGLYPAEAANVIARALLTKKESVGPWWIWPVEIESVVFRWLFNWAHRLLYHMSSDSKSALESVKKYRSRLKPLRPGEREAGQGGGE